jgi:hypothetical protein
MKRIPSLFLFLLFFAVACNQADKTMSAGAESDIDAARSFIRAALDGNFEKARTYLFQDSLNNVYMDVTERSYNKFAKDTVNQYRSASINIHNVQTLNDSVTLVTFSNSFRNDHQSLRVVKTDGRWQIDLKYLFVKPDAPAAPGKIDSVQ